MNTNQVQIGTAKINGAELYYEVSGQGEPLLMIHAGVADSRMWAGQFQRFAQAYQAIRFDLRGFGQSTLPPGKFCNHEDVRDLLTYLQIQQTYLLGISFGGLIALDFALAYPEVVKGLILGAPSISGETPSERVRAFWEAEEAALEAGDLAAATELNLRLWVDGPHRTPQQVNPAVREQVGEMQLNIFKKPVPDDIEESSLTPPAIERLDQLKMPLLVIVGSLDLEEKLAAADRLVAQAPQARKAVIPEAAHMMNMEKPDQFNQIVLDFLAGEYRQ